MGFTPWTVTVSMKISQLLSRETRALKVICLVILFVYLNVEGFAQNITVFSLRRMVMISMVPEVKCLFFLLPCFVLYGYPWTRSGKEGKFWLWEVAQNSFQLWVLTASSKSGFSCNRALQVIAVASTWHGTVALKEMCVYIYILMGLEFVTWLVSFWAFHCVNE